MSPSLTVTSPGEDNRFGPTEIFGGYLDVFRKKMKRGTLAAMLRMTRPEGLMVRTTLVATFAAVVLTTLSSSPADARPHGDRHGGGWGRAAPRGSVYAGRAPVVVVPVRPVVIRPYRPVLRPGFGISAYYGSPWNRGYSAYGPYANGYAYGYRPYAYGPGYGYDSGYDSGYAQPRRYGSVRLDIAQERAEVFVDGYYAGIVDDFDGRFQHLDLVEGPHRIEIRAEGYRPMTFNVDVMPDHTLTYRAALNPWDR
jgi:hypothetical protein